MPYSARVRLASENRPGEYTSGAPHCRELSESLARRLQTTKTLEVNVVMMQRELIRTSRRIYT